MDLWIRSQNEEALKKVHFLKILRNYEGTTLEGEAEYSYLIVDINQEAQSNIELGNYKTEERALEVLNEIHQRILDLHVGRNFDCVYQMPEK